MTEKMQLLLSHAGRCERLADRCRDEWVAQKLRQLADDYRELAAQRWSSIALAKSGAPPGRGSV
jgi:hypothetical protein